MNPIPTLKTGMFVVINNLITQQYKIGVIVNEKILYQQQGYDFVEELESMCIPEYSIEYILDCKFDFEYIQNHLEDIKSNIPVYGIKILWQYEQPPLKLTMHDIEEKFGCKVEIIDN